MGGEIQRGSLTHDTGYSTKAHCIGKQSYLEPNSGSMHVPIEGVYRITEKIEDRVAIEEKHNQNHAENAARTYLERIRNSMPKPIEGLSPLAATTENNSLALNKGGIVTREQQSTLLPARKHRKAHPAPAKTQNTKHCWIKDSDSLFIN